jgi:hypothetical protein
MSREQVRCPLWVKSGNARNEQMMSAFHPMATEQRTWVPSKRSEVPDDEADTECSFAGRVRGFVIRYRDQVVANNLISLFPHEALPLFTEADACRVLEKSNRLCCISKGLKFGTPRMVVRKHELLPVQHRRGK